MKNLESQYNFGAFQQRVAEMLSIFYLFSNKVTVSLRRVYLYRKFELTEANIFRGLAVNEGVIRALL